MNTDSGHVDFEPSAKPSWQRFTLIDLIICVLSLGLGLGVALRVFQGREMLLTALAALFMAGTIAGPLLLISQRLRGRRQGLGLGEWFWLVTAVNYLLLFAIMCFGHLMNSLTPVFRIDLPRPVTGLWQCSLLSYFSCPFFLASYSAHWRGIGAFGRTGLRHHLSGWNDLARPIWCFQWCLLSSFLRCWTASTKFSCRKQLVHW